MWRNSDADTRNAACKLATGIKIIIMINFSEITEQKIKDKYERLSQDLKDVLSSVKTSTTIESIATKYRLNEEKTTMLIQLVGLVILGFASFENIKEEMKETIGIDIPIISLVVDEIRQKIFLPVMNSLQKVINVPAAQSIPPTPVAPAMPVAPAQMPAPLPPRPVISSILPTSARPIDQYREPTFSAPEIVDLRKTPPPPTSPLAGVGVLPVVPAPISTRPPIPTPTMHPKPLTFTKPVTTPPLIEADPHRTPALTPTLRPPVSEVGAPTSPKASVEVKAEPHKISVAPPAPISTTPSADTYREPVERQPLAPINNLPTMDVKPKEPLPQYIMRPSGLPPTDFPRDVLDLRKDKGEF